MSWQLEKTLNKVRLGPKSLTVCLLQLHHLLRLTVGALELHGRRLQSGVWADKLKTLVLLFICSCSFCKPEQTSPPITHTCTHTHTLGNLPVWSSNTAPIELFNIHQTSPLWLAGLVSCNYEGGNWGEGSQLAKFSPADKPQTQDSICSDCVCFVCLCASERDWMSVCVCLCVGVFAKEELVKNMFSLQRTCDVQITSTDVCWAMNTAFTTT